MVINNKVSTFDISRAARLIQSGGLVAFPTETVYGLGANALDQLAVAKIFEAKKRPHFDPLIVHIAEISWLDKLCLHISPKAQKLIEKFWPGPLTIVITKKPIVPDIVTAGLPTVAIRMPSHSIARQLIAASGTPIAAPSANPFGYLSPTTAEHVREQLGASVDMIIDGGPADIGIESTVIEIINDQATLLRPGGVTLEEIEALIGPVMRYTTATDPHAPGQLKYHYSPHTPIRIAQCPVFEPDKKIGVLTLSGTTIPCQVCEILSPSGDLREAAANLFAALHRLDRANLDLIIVEPLPEIGLGRGIMNRIYKAAGLPTNDQ